MKLGNVLVSGALALAAVGFVPGTAQAVDCTPEETWSLAGKNCWACGWIMINGRAYILFPCD